LTQLWSYPAQLSVSTDSDSQRYDGYWWPAARQGCLNFEPHLHATGMRMCMKRSIRGRSKRFNCAGYDHNWVKNYQYDENLAPLLPKGTILHVIAWFDGTREECEQHRAEKRRPCGDVGRWPTCSASKIGPFLLTDAQYLEELAKRREYLTRTDNPSVIGCPGCWEAPPACGRRRVTVAESTAARKGVQGMGSSDF